jgi:hypothetical protein
MELFKSDIFELVNACNVSAIKGAKISNISTKEKKVHSLIILSIIIFFQTQIVRIHYF